MLALVFILLTLLLPRAATASGPAIPPGREQDILALFQPYALGDDLDPGWSLYSFSIDRATVHVWVAGPSEAFAHLTLDHIDAAPEGSQRLEGFALTIVDSPPGSEAAVAELRATIKRNDDGSFWRGPVVYASESNLPHDRALHSSRGTLEFRRVLERFDITRVWLWMNDGLVFLSVMTLVLLGLTAHKLRGAEPWVKWSLLTITLVGAGLRLSLSPEVGLEAWSFTRYLITARMILEGPALAALHPGPIWASELLTASTLALAILAPIAVFIHARHLLDDPRAALIVAGIVAVLPMHLRFSHSDVAFIPSITISSLLFTLVHVATREPSKWLGWFAVALVGVPLGITYLVRPLNIMYFALLIATAFVNHGVHGEKHRIHRVRVVVVFTIITLVTLLGGIPWLFESFGQQVSDGLGVETLVSAFEVMLSPRMNALLHPGFTPTGLTALAVVGAVDLWRRNKRPLFWYLTLWLMGFLVAHAYVVPVSPYMQARYHLHLIVPFTMLAACGVEASLRWLSARRERWLFGRRYHAAVALLVAYVCASPLIHLPFIRAIDFNEPREWKFVHSVRDEIPAECHIIEYIGEETGSRMARAGTHVQAGVIRSRWQVHQIPATREGEGELPDEVLALLRDPPECLVWYEGLPCFGHKPPERDKAPLCEAIEAFVVLEKITGTEFDSAMYDENLAVGLGDLERIELSLYRAYRKPG
jgi:hypothetical protein